MQCPTGKYQYKTAQKAHKAQRGKANKDGEWMNVYMCEWCGDWHLATREGRLMKKKARY